MKHRYKPLKPGEPSGLIKRHHKIACCDCGLVHLFRFEVIYTGKRALGMKAATIKRLAKELRPHVQFRAWRLERHTAAHRRARKVRESVRAVASRMRA